MKPRFDRGLLLSLAALIVAAGIGVGLYLSLSRSAQPSQEVATGNPTAETQGPSNTIEATSCQLVYESLSSIPNDQDVSSPVAWAPPQ